ncbi:unnamed protein product [Auanema sp. JU1783]|nr:unnamed protein product [Auanema sp. JU1783]
MWDEEGLEDRKDVVISKEMDYVSWEYPVLPNDESFDIEISNIRIKGVHKFEQKNLDSTDANEDLVLEVDGVKLHCHSPILSWNSEIFRAMIEEGKVSSEIYLKDTIPLLELRELLHYLYLPCEPVDDHNFRQLLHWGHKFEVKHVVQLCQHYMESLVLGPSITDAIRIEIFLLSWRYSVEHLKNIYARKETCFVSSDWMMKALPDRNYILNNIIKSDQTSAQKRFRSHLRRFVLDYSLAAPNDKVGSIQTSARETRA